MNYKAIRLLGCFVMLLLQSCGNKEVKCNEVSYDDATKSILYEGKPFTGKVRADDAHPNEYAIVRDGKIIDVIRTYERSNGYKKIEHQDGTSEYYDYDGNRINKSEYEKNK